MDIVQPWQRLVSVSSLLLAIVAGGFILHTLNDILLPFILAGFLSIVFKPLVHKMRSWRIQFPLIMLTVMLISAGALWLIYSIVALGV
ncbi:MAG: AI-2E family transporter, partial [Candidatus Kapabacteria bacterium]|nr:AI-2E family transporter [Candidatus Kapabacteria bacterium]